MPITPPPARTDFELAITVAKLALDHAERGRAPAAEIARMRGIISRLERR